ncbi:MAG: hypothetical protein JW751_09790 [Polyangiaceae bacterium]|nr:hypothetical protein [Polyangiaceae bacterium]
MTTTVKFVEAPEGELSTIEVHSRGPSTMMMELVRTLFQMRVEVLLAESHVSPGSRLERIRVREKGGGAVNAERRREVQEAVLALIEETLQHRRNHSGRSRIDPHTRAAKRQPSARTPLAWLPSADG